MLEGTRQRPEPFLTVQMKTTTATTMVFIDRFPAVCRFYLPPQASKLHVLVILSRHEQHHQQQRSSFIYYIYISNLAMLYILCSRSC